MNNLSISQLFALQEKAATPIEHALRKAAKAKRASTRVKYIEQAREMVAGGNFAFTVTELEWLISNIDYLWGNAEAPQELVEPSAPVESAIADNAPVKPVFEIGQWVMIEYADMQQLGKVEQVDSVLYYPVLITGSFESPYGDSEFLACTISELADASLVYDQPSLPAPKFAVGDLVTIAAEYESSFGELRPMWRVCLSHKMVGTVTESIENLLSGTRLQKLYSTKPNGMTSPVLATDERWFIADGHGGAYPVTREVWRLDFVLPDVTIEPIDHAFAWQAQRQADLTADNAQADKLIASFNAIEAYKAEVAYMQTQDAPIDGYLGGSENRQAER